MNRRPAHVVPCPARLRPVALRVLHRGLSPAQQEALADTLAHVDATDERLWDGLFVTLADEDRPAESTVAAATWVQPCPGNTAVVWPPDATNGQTEKMLRAAAAHVDARAIPLAQIVVTAADGFAAATLAGGGFPKLAELTYMSAAAAPLASDDGGRDRKVERHSFGGELAFASAGAADPERLNALIERSYAGTQDCPGLDGVRHMSDVLAGYRAQGVYHPDQWYVVEVRRAGAAVDAGALILAEHPAYGNWELVYMGVAPEFRGHGLGEIIATFALAAAHRAGGQRVVLAVDAANSPALRAYARAGFVEWDRRTVHARLARQ